LFKAEDLPPDLTIIGSHCVGIEILLREVMKKTQITYELSFVGSSGGLAAIMLGETDVAGIHLFDDVSGEYNTPFLKRYWIADRVVLVRGYIREQGLIVLKGNPKGITSTKDLLRQDVKMMNRELGSGTRNLLDIHLRKIADTMGIRVKDLTRRIKGYEIEAKSHSDVAQTVNQGKADVGLGIRAAVDSNLLDFLPLSEEKFDFAIDERRLSKPSVLAFLEALRSESFRKEIESHTSGIRVTKETGVIIYQP
jgi:putative molybdopterin biosynthesis protein